MIPFLLMSLWGCAPEDNSGLDTAGNNWQEVEFFDEEVSADGKATTRTYYVSNPNESSPYYDCSTSVYLKGTGSSLTAVTPSATSFTFDSKTSSGASTLSDTWYTNDGTNWDKDLSSGSSMEVLGTVTVRVTGTSVSRLQYYFGDNDCDRDF